MQLLFVVSTLLVAPPSTPTLDAILSDPAAQSSAAKAVVSRLEHVAESAKAAGQTPRQRYQQLAAWKSVQEVLTVAVRQVDPTVGPSSSQPLVELLYGAASLLSRDDLYAIQAGLSFIDMAIQPLERLRWRPAKRLVTAIAERVAASDNKTREALIRWLSNHGSSDAFEALLRAAISDKSEIVRLVAVQGIARCTDGYCPVTAETILKQMEVEQSSAVRTHWIAAAGRLRMPEIYDWCAGQLGGGALDLGCRTALLRVGDERAFNMFYEWLTQYEAVTAKAQGDATFAAAIAVLGRFAKEKYVKGKVLKLVDRALGRPRRLPGQLASIAGLLGYVSDTTRAIRSAKKHQRAYAKRAGKDASYAQVVEALSSTLQMLGRR